MAEADLKDDGAPLVIGEDGGQAQETAGTEPGTGGAVTAEADSAEDEALALRLGFVPKEQFRGRPEDWVDAKTFLRRNSALQSKVANLESKIGQIAGTYEQRFAALNKASDIAIRRAYEDRAARILAEQDEAARLGDLPEVRRTRKELIDLDREFGEEAASIQQAYQPARPQAKPETAAWMEQNAWFNTDPMLTQAAVARYNEFERFSPNTTEAQRLEYVDRTMAAGFPHLYAGRQQQTQTKPATRAPMPDVQGGSRPAATAKRGKAADLPAEARQAAQGYIKRGLFKDMNEYAEAYFEG